MVDIRERHGFRLTERDALLAYGEDPIEPESVEQSQRLTAFVEEMEKRGSRRCIANFDGTLFDTSTALSVMLEVTARVVVVSVPEDVLWGFESDPGNADIRGLFAFSSICKELASAVAAVLGYMGTEVLHPEDMTSGSAEDHGV